MIDNQIRAAEVIHKWPLQWIIHRVRQVTDQGDMFAMIGKLPQPKRASEDTHVGMDTANHNMLNFVGLKNVPDFIS